MGKLQNKIKYLENEIELSKRSLQNNSAALKENLKSPVILGISIVGGFAIGYIAVKKFDRKKINEHIKNIPALLTSVYNHLKVFLPLVST